jgi:hypothetical protein
MTRIVLTNEDRRIVRGLLDVYIKAPLYPRLSLQAVDRTRRWAFGETMTQIANDEGVRVARVSRQVRQLAFQVMELNNEPKKEQ